MKNIALLLLSVIITVAAYSQEYKEIKSSQLPKKTIDYINTNFKGSTIKRAAMTTDKDTKYVAVVIFNKNRTILIFDKSGNFITRARNMEEAKKLTSVSSSAKPTPAAKPPSNNPNTDPPKAK